MGRELVWFGSVSWDCFGFGFSFARRTTTAKAAARATKPRGSKPASECTRMGPLSLFVSLPEPASFWHFMGIAAQIKPASGRQKMEQ